jgi:hypothetical protein
MSKLLENFTNMEVILIDIQVISKRIILALLQGRFVFGFRDPANVLK